MSAASPASFQAALRAAVDRRGLPLDRVVARLRARGHSMSVATLSYWQSGRSVPSRQSSLLALGALEAILQVPRGSLARLVPMPVADVAARPTPRLADVMAQRARVDAILRDLNRELDDGVSLISVHMHAFADGTGQIPRLVAREAFTATRDGVAAYVVSGGHPISDVEIEVTAQLGCQTRRMIQDPTESVCVADLAFPALRRGQTHVLEYSMTFGGLPARGPEWSQQVVGVVSPVRELHVQVTFPPERPPETLLLVEGAGAEETRRPTPITLPTVTATRTQFGPGRLGFRWSIAPDDEPT